MSALGQLKEFVESLVRDLTGRTDERLDRLEERVTALEDRMSPAAAKTRPSVKARAGTAEVKGEATGA